MSSIQIQRLQKTAHWMGETNRDWENAISKQTKEGIGVPRNARVKSSTGIYHIMMRGIDKRFIFLQNQDHKQFLIQLKRAKAKSDGKVLAYCMMQNHVHLLLKEGGEEIGNTVRRINVGYAKYHNSTHDRVGHLFQGRFKSEAVNDQGYLYTVFRYIHQNPLKAGLVNEIGDYPWSSYGEYLRKNPVYVDDDFDDNPLWHRFSNKEEYRRFHQEYLEDPCMDFIDKKRITEKGIKNFMECNRGFQELQGISITDRNARIKKFKEETGASIRQMEKALGIGRGVIQKALK